MHRIHRFLDPRIRWGLDWLRYTYIVVFVITVLVASFGLGWLAGQQHNARYFEQHYRASMPIPQHVGLAPGAAPVRLPASASITPRILPSVGNQGPLGACECWAAVYYQLTYAIRSMHLSSGWPKFSPRVCYNYVDRGSDAGSWVEEDVATAVSPGAVKFSQYPYPPFELSWPLPALPYHQYNVSFHPVSTFADIQLSIVNQHPVNVDIPVYPEFDNAGNTNGYVGMPQPGEGSRGGHAITITGYDGNRNCFDIINSWSTYWGINGHGCLSYEFVERYAWGTGYIVSGAASQPHQSKRTRGATSSRATFPPPSTTTHRVTKSASWYVRGVVTNDTHVDISKLINAAGDRYHVWPVGLAAVLGTESSVNQYSDWYGVWPDVSFGICQVSVETLNSYGYSFDTEQARAWENNLGNCINLSARILRDYRGICGWDFAPLYACYNMGPYAGHDAYVNLEGQASSNYANFTGWLSYSEQHYAGGISPKPKFPLKKWCALTKRHHQHCPSHRVHGRLRSIARAFWHGHWRHHSVYYWTHAVKGPERWDKRNHVIRQNFATAIIYEWARRHGAPIKIVPHHWTHRASAHEPVGECVGCSWVPPTSLFHIYGSYATYSSPYEWDAPLIGADPVEDSDYMLPSGWTEPAKLPGDSRDHYLFVQQQYIDGSGWVDTFQTPNGGRFAYLHLSQVDALARFAQHRLSRGASARRCVRGSCILRGPDRTGAQAIPVPPPTGQWSSYRGDHQIGRTGWPSADPYCGSGPCGADDAHLCVVIDQRALDYFWKVVHRGPPPPRRPAHFNGKRWNSLRHRHHLKPIPFTHPNHHLLKIAWSWQYSGKHWLHAGHYKWAGPVKSYEKWDKRNHVIRQDFAHATAYEWSHKRGAPLKWVRRCWTCHHRAHRSHR